MRELADKAEAVTNPPNVTWQDLFTSRFVGGLPSTITEVPTLLVIEPATVVPDPDGFLVVTGFFEHSSDGSFAKLGRIAGTLNAGTREFALHKQGSGARWDFTGSVSSNGRVMHICITYEGYTTDAFPLVHENTAAQLVSDTPA